MMIMTAETPDKELVSGAQSGDCETVPVPVEILDGRQRLVFILGEVFGVSDELGAEIADVTPVNFRQILPRARRDLSRSPVCARP